MFSKIDFYVNNFVVALDKISVFTDNTTNPIDTGKLRSNPLISKPNKIFRNDDTKYLENFTGKSEKIGSWSNLPALRPDRLKFRSNSSYVQEDDRGVQLTFAETGHDNVFMMVRGNAFIQLDGEAIPTFQLR